MKCPKCDLDLDCPCKSCEFFRERDGKTPWEWDETGELVSCPNCNHTDHVDNWENLDYLTD